jgi:hypothetical protein
MCWRALTRRLLYALSVLAAALMPAAAGAEVLDELVVLTEQADAVIRVSFGLRIQYLRHEIFGDSLVDIYFRPLTLDGAPVTESRRIRPGPSFPGVEVVYPVQASLQSRKVTVRLTRSLKGMRVRPAGDRAVDIVVPGGAALLARVPALAAPAAPVVEAAPAPAPAPAVVPAPVPAPAARPPAPAPESLAQFRYLIRLASFASIAQMQRAQPLPGEFANYELMVSEARRQGRTEYDLVLGYFPTEQAAAQARQRLLRRFPQAEVVDLGETRPEPSVAAVAPAPRPPAPPAPPKPPPATAPVPAVRAAPPLPAPVPPTGPAIASIEVEARAAELMTAARAALDARRDSLATERLNELLMLPPNRQSRDAQELAGVARERSGEVQKARAEYELYLKLYPEGEGAARVQKRLDALAAPEPAGVRRAERAPLRALTGSLSQYYYGGRTRVETAFETPTTPDRSTFTATDLSALVTNVDVTLRNRTESGDTRFVLRDTNSASFLEDGQGSYNRLTAAYFDYRGLQNPLSLRVGRQTGLVGGLPHRFDGAIAGFGIGPKWRVNASVGAPVEYPKIESDRQFWAANLEYENLADAWSGNFFFIEQKSDGLLDRRAVGTEVRYFRGGTSLFSLLDYDTSYKEWNITMAQGTWQTEGRTTLNLMVDRRKAPTLTTTNAIFGQGTTSLDTLRLTLSEEQIRQLARDVTATATQALVGVTTPIAAKWQLGADARLTNVGPLPSVTVNGIVIPAQPATGDIYSYGLQAIGTNLYSRRDTSVFSLTYVTGPALDGYQLAYNNLSTLGDWTLEPSLRYYTQEDTQAVKVERWTPGLRLTYLIHERLAIEGEFIWEKTRTIGPISRDDTDRGFFYLGYRWNF